jgi:hypothetical protein
VVGAGAGAGKVKASVVVVDTGVGEVVDADRIYTCSMAVMTKSLELMV